MQNKIKIALIGCGRIANKHASLLGSGSVKGVALVAVCDSKADRSRFFGEKYSVKYFSDMHVMMKSIDVDIVVVLTESGNHAKHVIELASYGKHIIVEKPMALSLSDADEMIKACKIFNCKLFVVKQNRFNKAIVRLRERLDSNSFGKLIMGTVRVRWCRTQEYYDQDSWRGTWLLDGGVFANQASHHIDLLSWMMGDVETVYAKGMNALAKIEAEDTAVALLKFKSGALGVVEATTATRPKDLEGSISILGESGAAEIGGFAVNEIKNWYFSDENINNLISNEVSESPPNIYGFGHQAFYDDVINSLTNNSEALVTGLEGRKSVELICAIYESMHRGEEVLLPIDSFQSKLGRI